MATKTKTRRGATGARYTEDQLTKAEQMRAKGESYKSIGEALGIKATAYLSTVLKRREADRDQAAKVEKASSRKPRAKTATPAA